VGPSGRVIGVDMTDEMLAMARRNAPIVMANLGYPAPNVEFRKGHAENLPVEDGSIDLIISNCVINLSPHKAKVFRELHRATRRWWAHSAGRGMSWGRPTVTASPSQ